MVRPLKAGLRRGEVFCPLHSLRASVFPVAKGQALLVIGARVIGRLAQPAVGKHQIKALLVKGHVASVYREGGAQRRAGLPASPERNQIIILFPRAARTRDRTET